MGSSRLRVFDPHLERKDSEALSGRQLPLPTFDVPYFKYIDEEDEDDEWSSRSQSSTEDDSVDSLLSDRYMVVSGTPEKILEHLLNDLHLAEVQHKETGKLEWGRGLGVCAWGLLSPQQQQLVPVSIPRGEIPTVWEIRMAGKAYALCGSPHACAVCFSPVNGHM